MPYTSLAGEIIARHLEREREFLPRASLVLWRCEACGGDTEVAVPTAAAIELFSSQRNPPGPNSSAATCRTASVNASTPADAPCSCLQSTGRGRRRFATPPARSSMIVTTAFVEGIERRNGAILGLVSKLVLSWAAPPKKSRAACDAPALSPGPPPVRTARTPKKPSPPSRPAASIANTFPRLQKSPCTLPPKPPKPGATPSRKAEHIRINVDRDVGAKGVVNGLDAYRFTHRALPNIDLRRRRHADVELFGKVLAAPIQSRA